MLLLKIERRGGGIRFLFPIAALSRKKKLLEEIGLLSFTNIQGSRSDSHSHFQAETGSKVKLVSIPIYL